MYMENNMYKYLVLILLVGTGCTVKVLNFGDDYSQVERTDAIGYNNEENKNGKE